MIRVVFTKKSGNFSKVSVSGHAGYEDSGRDIVCAAVTSAVQLTANSITEVFETNAKVSVKAAEVVIDVSDFNATASKLMEALYLHLDILSQEYSDYIEITVLEV